VRLQRAVSLGGEGGGGGQGGGRRRRRGRGRRGEELAAKKIK
jgi:hypothetical protein